MIRISFNHEWTRMNTNKTRQKNVVRDQLFDYRIALITKKSNKVNPKIPFVFISSWLQTAGLTLALATFLHALTARADSWTYWSSVPLPSNASFAPLPKLATDGTNLYYSTILSGVYRASLADGQFSVMPMTGFPLWSTNNTNGFAVWNIGVSAPGILVISGSPINVTSNGVSSPPSSFNNTLPVFYWWDEANQLWNAAGVTNKSYPYTSSAGDFALAPDGALWSCSGFASYVYRSTDGGKNYTAFDVNARVPTNYFPVPPTTSQTTFGKIFSIVVTPKNEVIIGTETGGFLHSTNNGQTWFSLDPNFTNTNSPNPLGRIGNAFVTGIDRYGHALCANGESTPFPGSSNWVNVKLIGYNPADGSYSKADYGTPVFLPRVFTTPAGVSVAYANQSYLLTGGIYRSYDGAHWSQFNTGIPSLTLPFGPDITNAVAKGDTITALGAKVFVGAGNGEIYLFDSTPPSITNHPPVAIAQNLNLIENTPAAFTLVASDGDGDPLSFIISPSPAHGHLSGTPPNLVYTPSNNFTGLDLFYFAASDGNATSAPVLVNVAINTPTNTPPTVSLDLAPAANVLIVPANITLTATASDPDGIMRVNFSNGTNLLAQVTNAPYVFTATNLAAGDYIFSARANDTKGTRTWSTPVRVLVFPAPLRVGIEPASSNQVALTWPLEINNALLESATNIAGPWSIVPTAPLDRKYLEHIVTLPTDDPATFFRLNATP
jgi:hypothetical protein